MKVNIGPHSSDLIPVYSWKRKYGFWRSPERYFLGEEEYTKFDKFVLDLLDKLEDLVHPINRWSNRRKRKVDIHIDYYDVWSAEHTLAMIIAPTLKKLKEEKHGSPLVDDEDVPETLRANKKDPDDLSQDDSTIHERWAWVLDEMIWTFEQHAMQDDTDQFHHNVDQLDMIFTPVEGKKVSELTFNHQKDPSKPKYWRDYEGLKKHHERKANGRRLFAKYYEALWD